MEFTHLHLHTHYSLLDGLSKIPDLIDRIKELGMDSVAITDHGNLYGAIEFYKKAKAAGIKPIIGCELYISKDNMDSRELNRAVGNYNHLVVLAKNETGYRNLILLVTAGHLDGFYYKPRVDKELLKKHAGGLIALSGCLGGEISRALLGNNMQLAKKICYEYADIFGKENFYLELQQHPNIPDQNLVTTRILELSRKTGLPIVATQDAHYLRTKDAKAHDVLLAVQTQNRTDDQDRLTMKEDDFSITSAEQMYKKFSQIPDIRKDELTALIENTKHIADACNLEIGLGKLSLPNFPLPQEFKDHHAYLRYLTYHGLSRRYNMTVDPANPPQDNQIIKRLEYELNTIKKTGFDSYFLIVQDFVNWAKGRGIVVGPGRGSAAGSLVSYLLGITNIDPLRYNLYFERFLNPERISPPDIDLDFDDARRDEVIQYVANKFGRDRVAQIITFGTMMSRGAVRDAGRALGVAYDLCDQIAKMIPFSTPLKKALEIVPDLKQLYDTNNQAHEVLDAAQKLEGVARHASTHACGVVIAPDALINYLPLQRAGKNDQSIITQYGMRSVEDIGLLKMDFLGLANLTIIEQTLRLVQERYGHKIVLDNLPLDDKKTFQLLQRADTVGVFQLESDGMRRYLKQLKPTNIDDIIAMVALYRPGPMELIPNYIRRKHGQEPVNYLHPKLESGLKSTYGIGVFQEQMMQIARDLAGYSMPEADTLRKAIGKKIKSLLEEQKEKLITGMKKNGITSSTAQKIWELFPPFARYGFPKAHAACYATIAYQTAYLKAHYPMEFMAALMNSDAGDIERVAFLIEHAREMEIEVLSPQINESRASFTVVSDQNTKSKIRFGLSGIKNVGANIINAIIEERDQNGEFNSIEDLIQRVKNKDLNKKSLESLIKCGAVDSLGERNQLLENIDKLLVYARETQRNGSNGQIGLFDLQKDVTLPKLRLNAAQPANKHERLSWEKELLGLFVSDHPLRDYQSHLIKEYGVLDIKSALKNKNGFFKIGGILTKIQRITTRTGQLMLFGWLEDLTSRVELVIFPKLIEKNPAVWQENNILVIKGRMNEKDGVPKVICEEAVPVATLT